jgi:hypothetical protein
MDQGTGTMTNELAIPIPAGALVAASGFTLPAVIADHGDKAAEGSTGRTRPVIRKKPRVGYDQCHPPPRAGHPIASMPKTPCRIEHPC